MIKVVEKKWGREEWLVNTELYCTKYLFVNPGAHCSYHMHQVKDETFYVLSGEVMLETGREAMPWNGDAIPSRGLLHALDTHTMLRPGESWRIRPEVWHRFFGCGPSVSMILEVSTHHDEADSYRNPNHLSAAGK